MNLASPQCSAKTTFTDLNGHGTHVAGSVLGNGTRSGSNAAAHAYTSSHAGTAPEASLVFMALNTDGSSGIQCIDLNGDFLAKGYQEGARISSNSWGANTAGGYNQISSLVDDYIWRHKDYLVLYAASNAGPGAQTVGAPGTAKNVLTVGASENNRPDKDADADNPNSMAGFSSRGPTADGRIKPDVVAPGTWVLSVRAAQAPDGSFWGNFNQDYAFMGGTSMATPLAAGGAALVREWMEKARGIAAPSAALLKALLVNGATQLPGEKRRQQQQRLWPYRSEEHVGRQLCSHGRSCAGLTDRQRGQLHLASRCRRCTRDDVGPEHCAGSTGAGAGVRRAADDRRDATGCRVSRYHYAGRTAR